MAANDPQLKFRVPSDLRSKLEKSAEANNRSLSAEIVSRLEGTFESSLRQAASAGDIASIMEQYRSDMARTVRLAEDSQMLLLALLYDWEKAQQPEYAEHLRIAREGLKRAHPKFDPDKMPFFPRAKEDEKPE